MAFRVPGEFSDVFVGSVHSMSCVLKRSWLVRTWSWLQPELRLARHIWVELVGGDLAGGATGICRSWLGGVLC